MAQSADMEDWSLQAIVRGSSGDLSTKIVDMDTCDLDYGDNLFFDFNSGTGYQSIDHEFYASFPEIFDRELMGSRNGILEELYKPFYHVPAKSPFEFQDDHEQKTGVVDYKRNHDQSDRLSGNNIYPDSDSVCKAVSTPKYKRRKNQHKRVVIQVSADDIASDKWAWRKYGQKPIKGSPYPRSYYRCSSSKGCLARKQVEQSCTDPGMFIITYTAEHSHSQPTRRNSLSGTIRQKFPSSKAPNMPLVKQEKEEEPSTPNSTKTLKRYSSTHDVDFHPRIKLEGKVVTEDINHDAHDDFDMSDDLILNGEFFSGLEDFDDFVSELANSHASSPQFPARSCS